MSIVCWYRFINYSLIVHSCGCGFVVRCIIVISCPICNMILPFGLTHPFSTLSCFSVWSN